MTKTGSAAKRITLQRTGGRKTTEPMAPLLAGVLSLVVVMFLAACSQGTSAAVMAEDAVPLTAGIDDLEAGTYRVDAVGTPFTFTIDEPMFMPRNAFGQFVITAAGSLGPDDRDIVVMRLSELSDPATSSGLLEGPGQGWSGDDFDGWVANLADGYAVSNREDVVVGGLDATRIDLSLEDADCLVGVGRCVSFGTNHFYANKDLTAGSSYRIYGVDQGGEDVMAIIVGINRETDVDWFDTADEIISTVAFGAVEPNPLSPSAAGPTEMPFLGGFRAELAVESVVVTDPRGIGRIGVPGQLGDSEFVLNPFDGDGTALSTAADLTEELEAKGLSLGALDPVQVDGIEAQVFDISGRSDRPLIKTSADAEDGWRPPGRGRMWLIEHPGRGLMMVTAEAYTGDDDVFASVLAQTESIVNSIEFTDPD